MPESRPSLRYRGRFAPSPTGPLHFGSLVAAVGSYLEARSQGGEWLLRMEDVDQPRCQPAAADDILRTLEGFGFAWDGPVVYQQARQAAYEAALAMLRERGLAYACGCSRKEIAEAAHHPAIDGGLAYPGTCRAGLAPGRSARAWRFRVPDGALSVVDRVQGEISQDLAQDVGDFVLLRADGYFAYQLAVVVDDLWQGITHIVRGADLLDSTPRQVALLSALGGSCPDYTHLPVATYPSGEKLSKQTLAPALDSGRREAALVAALRFLGQDVPRVLDGAPLAELWDWATTHWSLARVPRVRGVVIGGYQTPDGGPSRSG